MKGVQLVLYKECQLRVADGNGGYTDETFHEDDLHRPLIPSSNLNNPVAGLTDGTNYIGFFNDIHPRKGHFLDEVELPIPYEQFMGLGSASKTPKYLMMTAKGEYGAGSAFATQAEENFELFGWIDSIEPVATKGAGNNTRIRWHVDYWMTLQRLEWNAVKTPTAWSSRSLKFGRGRFKRGPEGMQRPDPSTPRMWLYDSDTILRDYSSLVTSNGYCIVSWNETVNSVTVIKTAYWRFNDSETVSGTTYYSPSMREIYSGQLEEILNVAASAIIGVWFSPIAYGTASGVLPKVVTKDYTDVDGNTQHRFIRSYEASTPLTTAPVYVDLTGDDFFIKTTDTEKYIVMDPKGTIYGTLPWGIEFRYCKMTLDVGTSGAWLILCFRKTSVATDYMEPGEGRQIEIPLISAPITSNALSEYAGSGQQEYDRKMAELQQETNLKSGIAGGIQGAASGAIGGALVGKGAGALVGSAVGAGMSILQAQVNYQIGTEHDTKSQALYNTLMANQISNVISRVGGPMWKTNEDKRGFWRVVKLVRDPLSKGELETEQAELGYVCDTYTVNCTTVIANGGPMRIEGLEVLGDISNEAKRYIAAMFARGVHLDLIY